MELSNVKPADVTKSAIEGGSIAALAFGGWQLLKHFALGAATLIEGIIPTLLPPFVLGAVTFGALKLMNQAFGAKK